MSACSQRPLLLLRGQRIPVLLLPPSSLMRSQRNALRAQPTERSARRMRVLSVEAPWLRRLIPQGSPCGSRTWGGRRRKSPALGMDPKLHPQPGWPRFGLSELCQRFQQHSSESLRLDCDALYRGRAGQGYWSARSSPGFGLHSQ